LRHYTSATNRAICELIASDDPEDITSGLLAISRLAADNKSIFTEVVTNTIVTATQSSSARLRGVAVALLPHLNISEQQRLRILTDLLSDGAMIAADAIQQLLDWQARPATPELCHALLSLLDQEPSISSGAAELLGLVASNEDPVVSALSRLTSRDDLVACTAIVSLFRITGTFEIVGQRIAELLNSGNQAVVEAACDSVSTIGHPAVDVLPQLFHLIGTTESDVQWAAADAVRAASSGNPDALSALTRAKQHQSEDVRILASTLLKELQNKPRSSVTNLIKRWFS
jgi:hypothetical protein